MEKVTSFKSATGALFDSENAAWRADLEHWLKFRGIDNQAVRLQIATILSGSTETLLPILDGVRRSATVPPDAWLRPKTPPVAPLPVILEGPVILNNGLIRCMGGKFCDHAPGTCTATHGAPGSDGTFTGDITVHTKQSEMINGCFAAAKHDEPIFVLLARDPSAPALVRDWAHRREIEINACRRPSSDMEKVKAARDTADQMEHWRVDHDGEWRSGLFGNV